MIVICLINQTASDYPVHGCRLRLCEMAQDGQGESQRIADDSWPSTARQCHPHTLHPLSDRLSDRLNVVCRLSSVLPRPGLAHTSTTPAFPPPSIPTPQASHPVLDLDAGNIVRTPFAPSTRTLAAPRPSQLLMLCQ